MRIAAVFMIDTLELTWIIGKERAEKVIMIMVRKFKVEEKVYILLFPGSNPTYSFNIIPPPLQPHID